MEPLVLELCVNVILIKCKCIVLDTLRNLLCTDMCVCLETWSSVLFTFPSDYSKWSLDSSCEKKNQVVK